jgi:5-hydroxyisourate hydrolase-like protein (transthyretin family)
VVVGRYKMHFEVKKYFTLGLHDTFYPFIEVSEPLVIQCVRKVAVHL